MKKKAKRKKARRFGVLIHSGGLKPIVWGRDINSRHEDGYCEVMTKEEAKEAMKKARTGNLRPLLCELVPVKTKGR